MEQTETIARISKGEDKIHKNPPLKLQVQKPLSGHMIIL